MAEGPNAAGARRSFLKQAMLGWLSLVLGPGLYAYVRGTYLKSSRLLLQEPLAAGTVTDFVIGNSRVFSYGQDRVMVIRVDQERFVAVSGVCTHLGCSVRFHKSTEEIFCNCHESRFALDGEQLEGPASIPLKRYAVTTRGGKVLVHDPESRP